MKQQFPIFLGIVRYEFSMQIRRLALWITVAIVAFFGIFIASGGPIEIGKDIVTSLAHESLLAYIAGFNAGIQQYAPLIVGCLLADRLIRDRRIKVDELFFTLNVTLSARLLGKYVGTLLATMVPIFIVYFLQLGYILAISHNLMVIPLALLTYIIIALPGLLFVAAFSLACPVIMPVPLYQFLFVGYWFWGNMFIKQHLIPTLSRTILTPSGVYMTQGFFQGEPDLGPATPLQATASMLLLSCITISVMLTLGYVLKWQQARQ